MPMKYPMNNGFELIKRPRLGPLQERRQNNRKACSIKANYMIQGCWYRGSIQNISDGGAYISPIRGEQFSPSEEMFLVARIRVLRHQLRGKIAWVGPHGMGVEFQTGERI